MKLFNESIPFVLTGFISLVIGIYIEKFKSRVTYLKYRLFFNPLATSTQDSFWGNITVLYNGRRTNHLSFGTIEISNDSNSDLQDVNIDVWVDSNSKILGQNGHYEQTGNAIFLEKKHEDYIQSILHKIENEEAIKSKNSNYMTPTYLQNEINWVYTNRKFQLPIFNRKTSIKLNILTENLQGFKPIITTSILHKSVKLIEQNDKSQEDRKLGLGMVIWGLIFYILGLFILNKYFINVSTPLLIAGILGVLHLFIGLLIYKIIGSIRQALL